LDIAITEEDVAQPAPAGHWRFWGTVGWGLVVLIVSNLIQGLAFVAVALREYYSPHAVDGMPKPSFIQAFSQQFIHADVIFWGVILANIISCGLIYLIVRLKNGESTAVYLCIRGVPAATLLKWIGITAVFLIVSELALNAFHIDLGAGVMKTLYKETDSPWLFWAAAVLAAPLFEEIFFRGFLFRGFETSFLKPAGTIALTSALWAAMHIQYNLLGMGFIFCTGIVFGLARARTRSLLVPMTLHAAMNFTDLAGSVVTGG
jgi:membrane protease YdiL (CAAX protease family)